MDSDTNTRLQRIAESILIGCDPTISWSAVAKQENKHTVQQQLFEGRNRHNAMFVRVLRDIAALNFGTNGKDRINQNIAQWEQRFAIISSKMEMTGAGELVVLAQLLDLVDAAACEFANNIKSLANN